MYKSMASTKKERKGGLMRKLGNYYNQNINFKIFIITMLIANITLLAYMIYYYYTFKILLDSFPSIYFSIVKKILSVCYYRLFGYFIFVIEGVLLIFFFWMVPLGIITRKFENWLYENLSYSEIMHEKDEQFLKKYLGNFSTKNVLVLLTVFIPGIYVLSSSLASKIFLIYFNIAMLIISYLIFNVYMKTLNDLKLINDTQIPKFKDKLILSVFINYSFLIGFFFIFPDYMKYLLNISYNIYWGNFPTTIQNIVNIYRITDPSGIPQNLNNITAFVQLPSKVLSLNKESLIQFSSIIYSVLGFPAIAWVVYSSFLSGIKRIFISSIFFIIGASIPRIISFSIYGGTLDMILFGYILSGFGVFGTSIIRALTRKWTLVECIKCSNFVEKEYEYCPYCGEKI